MSDDVQGDLHGKKQGNLFSEDSPTPQAEPQSKKLVRRDGITDAGLAHFQVIYPSETIGKQDIFYYIYGILHSQEYRNRYADNLAKELPRIPCVKTSMDFWAFALAGRKLGDLHVHYETVQIHEGIAIVGPNGKPMNFDVKGISSGAEDEEALFHVEKMKYGKNGKDKDLTTLIYNDKITLKGIPLEAYEYVINGKSALDWVVERQCVKTDKDSGITNDANTWAVETMRNPRYPLELFLRIVTVSIETMKIVKGLPRLDILDGSAVIKN